MRSAVDAWDLEADVVVVGTGGAGLTAAILAHDQGAKVAILERSDKVGGTTAVSGGGVWIPMNHHMAEAGTQDTREEALTYCKRLAAGRVADDLVETAIDTGPEMLRYMEEHTPLVMRPWTIPDYMPALEGAKMGGRSLEPELFNKGELGSWEDKLRPTATYFFPVSLQDMIFTYQAHAKPQNMPADLIVERMEQGLVACGNALIGRLLKGCLDRGIEIILEARARELVIEGGRVAGLRAERDGGDYFARALGGVVLASGGFEWNEELKAQFLPGMATHPNSPPYNEGDGLIMASEVGAALGNMTEVWGSPASPVPGEEYEGRPFNRLIIPERACPHAILVNRQGRRFVNEGASYNELGKAFNELDAMAYEYRNLPCWAISDRQYRETYPILTVMPGDPDPEWLPGYETLDELADAVGIDPQGLRETVERWNGYVGEGNDPDFGRHSTPIDISAPHPSLGTIEQPPFHALPVYQGTLGTKGGPRTNTRGEVLDVRGETVQGLYAAGNVMASAAGPGYGGGGATIGLGMIWGYICGINAAEAAKGS